MSNKDILKRKKEIISKYLSTVKKSGIMREIRSNLSCRESQDGSKERILTLQIKTNSESPIYQDWYGDDYTEVIANDAFDKSLEEVKSGERIVYSFADHDMDMKNVISSTNRAGTKLYKDENQNYVMEIALDPAIELHKTIITIMENGEAPANSFIFMPEEIDIEIDEAREDIDYKLIQKKGVLISVDPVISAFYPQNETSLKEKAMSKQELRAKKETEVKVEVEAQTEVQEVQVEEPQPEAEVKPEVKVVEEAKVEETEAKEELEVEQTEVGKKVQEINEQNNFVSSEAEERKQPEVVKQEKGDVATRTAILEANEKIKEESKMTEAQKRQLVESFIKRGNVEITKERLDEVKSAIAERNQEVINKYGITEDELKLFNLRATDLTGADAAHGALIIPVSTDPTVVGQDVVSMPEFDGASRMSMSGLEEKKVPVDVDAMGVAAVAAEGVDANELAGTVVKVQFAPKRYPVFFNYNPLLAEHANFVAQKTVNAQNSIKRAWLKGYYDSLLAGAATAFAGNEATYAGGISSEAAIETSASGKVGQADLDAAILDIEAEYGTIQEGTFKFEMQPSTWAAVVEEARAAGNSALIRVVKGQTQYGGVDVIVRKQFPDAVAAGKHAVVMSKKSNTKIYGGIIIVKNSMEHKFLAEENTRLVVGRGEAKLCDPHYTTRALKVKA